jgi:hypothetical protein
LAISGAWKVAAAGHHARDRSISNFTRFQAMFRLEYNF